MIGDMGTDIKSEYTFFNGDLILVDGTLNLGQAILNRLVADSDTYSMFYNRYGGGLFYELGSKNIASTWEYIRIEVESILQQEPRIQNVECTVNKINSSEVSLDLTIQPINEDMVVEFNLVINSNQYILTTSDNGVLIENRNGGE